MHANQLPNHTGHRHGCFRFNSVVGFYHGEPQYSITCEACLRRHTVRTARSMFNSHEVTCGCRRHSSRRYPLLRTVLMPMIFGRLKVVDVVGRVGRLITYECRCGCGAAVLANEQELRDGTTWACPSCIGTFEGLSFGRLYVRELLSRGARDTTYKCQCRCRATVVATERELRDGTISACPSCVRGPARAQAA